MRRRTPIRRGGRLPFMLFFLLTAALGAEEVVFAVGEWSPFVGAALPDQGTAAITVRNICARADITPRFDFYPWVRAELRVLEGRAFAGFPYERLSSREGRFLYSDPIFHSPSSVLRARADPRTTSFRYEGMPGEFRPYIVGTTAGSESFVAPLRAAGVVVEDTSTIDQSVRKLAHRRIHFVVEDRAVLEDSIRRLYPGKEDLFVFLDRDFTEPRAYQLLVSKKYPGAETLLERFNAALRRLRAEGKLPPATGG